MAEEPPPPIPPQTRRLAAVWFADIVGYTRLCSENQTTALWQARLLHLTAQEVNASTGGRVVKRLGDAVLAEFPSTNAAVVAALRLQQSFQHQTRMAGAEASLRVGIHVGDVVVEGGDVFGDGVNLASRLQEIADPGRVVISEDVWRQIRGEAGYSFRALGEQELAGVSLRMSAFDVEATAVEGAEGGFAAGGMVTRRSSRQGQEAGAACPYVGLRAFSEADAALYFGRESFARQLFERIHQQGVVAVISASGSGKSSLVQAGVLPLLRRQLPEEESWDALVFTPGSRPFHNLAEALVHSWTDGSLPDRLREAERLGNDLAAGAMSVSGVVGATLRHRSGKRTDRLLLVVDQFEELFTQTREEPLRQVFAEQLLAAADERPVRVVLMLRADFYGQAIGLSRRLNDSIQQGLVNLGPMTREELRRAVVEPAMVLGLQFEPGLVDRILDDVIEQPGPLPLLEFALTELWSRREVRMLTHAAYELIGRVEGAIGRRADRELSRWSPEQQQRLVSELTRLVHIAAPQEEGTDTRLRETMSGWDASVQAMIRSFADARLLVTDRNDATGHETVEVAHEALIRSWPRLRNTLNADRSFLLWRQRLRHRLAEWKELSESADLLLKGPLLAEARSWARGRDQDLKVEELEFIKLSSRAARGRRKLALSAAVVVGILLTTAGGVWGFTRTDRYQIGSIVTAGNRIVAVANDSTAAGWYAALIGAGRLEEALAGARTIEEVPRRSRALARIAVQLSSDGRPSEAEQVRLEALQLALAEVARARDLNDPVHKADVYAQALPALVESGEPVEAASLAEEAFLSAQAIASPERRDQAMYQFVTVFTRVGKLDLALAVARSAVGNDASFHALIATASELMNMGQVGEALFVLTSIDSLRRSEALESALFNFRYAGFKSVDSGAAMEMLTAIRGMEEPPPDMALFAVGPDLIKAGAAREVLLAVRAIEDSVSRNDILRSLVPALAVNRHFDEARQILETQQPSRFSMPGQVRLALELARTGASQEALTLVPEVLQTAHADPNPAAAVFLFAQVAETYEIAGRMADAQAVVVLADSAAQRIRDEDARSNHTAEVAKRYAELGVLRTAREVADRPYVSDNDRLEAYTTILLRYLGKDTATPVESTASMVPVLPFKPQSRANRPTLKRALDLLPALS